MHYLVIADRLSGWSESYRIRPHSGSRGLLILLKQFFGTFGVPEELSSDGGKEFIADVTQDFFLRWEIKHRLSSAYNPQSNGRAELAVKSTKRLLEDNIGADGELHTDKFLQAMLIKRNTPDPVTKLSPAEIIFGRKLRDSLPRINKKENIFFHEQFRASWRDAWKQKELALRTRYQGCQKRLEEHSKALPPLRVGDRVSIQNQYGRRPNKWERTGTIVEERDFDKYVTKVDGSGRLTLRNRRFLKKLYQDKGMFHNGQPAHPNRSALSETAIGKSQAFQTPSESEQPCSPPSIGHLRPVADVMLSPSKSLNDEFAPTSSQGTCKSSDLTVSDEQQGMPRQLFQTPQDISKLKTSSAATLTPPMVPSTPTCTNSGRPTRLRKQTKLYDASLGKYVDRMESKQE